MRGLVSNCVVKRPESLQEALEILASAPGQWMILAGGTDIMVRFNAGRLNSESLALLDISLLVELKALRDEGDHLHLGALCTYSELRAWPLLHATLPNLIKSAKCTGALAIQNRGTLGGNISNASPAADTPPSLLAYGAELELLSLRGARRVPYDAFHLDYKKLDLAGDELITAVRLPKPTGTSFHFFRKVGTRQAQAIAKLSLAAYARLEEGKIGEIRIGLGSVGPVPLRAQRTESVLTQAELCRLPVKEAREALDQDICPIDDVRSTAHYRKVVCGNVLEQMLGELGAVSRSK